MMTLIEQIKHILATEEISQVKLAQQIGISGGALSSYLSGNYKGNNDRIVQALENWLAMREKKTQVFVEAPDFIITPTTEQITHNLEIGQFLGRLVTVYGASGVGKTKTANQYMKNHNNVWMVTASPARASLSAILYELALAMNSQDAPRRKDKLSSLIRAKLKDTKGMVIIDEADHLTYDAIEELRLIQDETEIGMAFIGNDQVYTRMQGGINQAHKYARLWSRVGKHCHVKSNSKGDIKAIAEAWGLNSQDKDLMTTLYSIGGKAGGLRALTQYLRLAGISAKGQGTTITLDLILAAQAQMTGGNA